VGPSVDLDSRGTEKLLVPPGIRTPERPPKASHLYYLRVPISPVASYTLFTAVITTAITYFIKQNTS